MASWRIRSQRVVLPDGVVPAEVHVANGRIAAITKGTSGTLGTQGTLGTLGTPGTPGTQGTPGTHGTQGTLTTLIDAGAMLVLPGLVDTHVHIN